jgi:hypothetical protein
MKVKRLWDHFDFPKLLGLGNERHGCHSFYQQFAVKTVMILFNLKLKALKDTIDVNLHFNTGSTLPISTNIIWSVSQKNTIGICGDKTVSLLVQKNFQTSYFKIRAARYFVL